MQEDDWTTVEEHHHPKKKPNSKYRQERVPQPAQSVNAKFSLFLTQARAAKNNLHDPTELFKAVSVV